MWQSRITRIQDEDLGLTLKQDKKLIDQLKFEIKYGIGRQPVSMSPGATAEWHTWGYEVGPLGRIKMNDSCHTVSVIT